MNHLIISVTLTFFSTKLWSCSKTNLKKITITFTFCPQKYQSLVGFDLQKLVQPLILDVANGHQINSTLVKILVKVVYNMEYYKDNNFKLKDFDHKCYKFLCINVTK